MNPSAERGSARAQAKRLAKRAIRRGNRTIVTTPFWVRFGNLLYLWMRASIEQDKGRDLRILANEAARPWLAELPLIRETLSVEEMRLWDRREWPKLSQDFGSDFDRKSLETFIETMLLPAPLLWEGRLPELRSQVVVNVRRGDYYSHPEHRANYGFDVEPYLGDALVVARARRDFTSIRVVSDDIEWCRANLGGILSAHSDRVSYSDPRHTPADDFRAICAARTLICANSTFSYWGGYVSSVVHGAESHVIAPDCRIEGVAPQLDPKWDVVRVVR